jgi:formylglycine-generating enzyme required for sulfatase activity
MEIAHAKSIPILPARLHECNVLVELSNLEAVDLFEDGGYLKLRNLLAARAKEIDATPPLTSAFYITPKINGDKRSSERYAPLAALFFIVIIAVLFVFRQILLPASPALDIATTSPITVTVLHTSTPAKPEFAIYKPEIVDQTGAKMRFVKSGEFTMGYEAEEALSECKKYSSNCLLNQYIGAEPVEPVYLAPYYIDTYEVTNRAYQKCVEAKICQPPKKTGSTTRTEYFGTKEFALFPVVYVDWEMAKTYCEEWREARLPTEAEWEKAARGSNGYLFPWGNELGGLLANFCDKNCFLSSANKNLVDDYPDTAPVYALSGGVSVDGVYNLAGNVWEWVSSLYKPYPYDPDDGRENLEQPGIRVLRGGSWRDDVSSVFSFTRNGYDPSTANDSIGFRCAKTP